MKYDVDEFLKDIECVDPEEQLRVAKECLDRFQQSFHPHEAYQPFYVYFMWTHNQDID
jgi:hypothetical protein